MSEDKNIPSPLPPPQQQATEIMLLELREELAASNIVRNFEVDFRVNEIRLDLNGKYKNHTVVSDFKIDKWRDMVKAFKEELMEKDVDAADIKNIKNTLDSNNARLANNYVTLDKIRAEHEKRILEAGLNPDFDEAIDVIRNEIVKTFVDETNRPTAVVRVGEHVENKFMNEGSFVEWLAHTYYVYAEQKRLEAEASGDIYVPSQAKSYLSKENKEKIQTLLIFEALGVRYEEDEEYEKTVMAGFEDQNEIDLRAVGMGLEPEKRLELFKGREDTRVKLDLRAGSQLSFDPAKKNENYVIYDLGDETWSYIEVTAERGPQLVKSTELTPSPFKRYKNTSPQFIPNLTDDFDPNIFDKFMENTNVYKNEKNKMLCKVYIVSLFMMPRLPRPVLAPTGSQGTGKSTFQEHIKRLFDPADVLTISAQSDVREMVQTLSHHALTIIDNVSEIKDKMSDLYCRAVTGTGYQKRALYTDDTDFTYKMIRAIGFNGLNIVATRPDLLERILKITLDPINKDDRQRLSEINRKFEDMLPQVLGYIFDVIHKVLQRFGEVRLKELPRMADWTEIGELIARVLGYKEMEFVNAYFENLAMTSGEAVDANPIATAVITFMEEKNIWVGSAAKLLDELNSQERSKGHTYIVTSKSWPKGAGALSGKLAEIIPNLKDVGIICDRKFDRHSNKYEITLVNQGVRSSPSSPDDDGGNGGGGRGGEDSSRGPPPSEGLFGFGSSDGGTGGETKGEQQTT